MIEWLKIRDKNGNDYLVNAGDISYISEDGIVFLSGRYLPTPQDIEEVERVIIESRKTGERWLNGKTS